MLAWAVLHVHTFMSDTGPRLSPKPPMPTFHGSEQATNHSQVPQYVASSQSHTVPCLVQVEGVGLVSPRASELRPPPLPPCHVCRWLRNGLCPHQRGAHHPPSPVSPRASGMCQPSFCWGLPIPPPNPCNWQLPQRPHLHPPIPSVYALKCVQMGQSPLNSYQPTGFCPWLFRTIVLL